MSAEGTIICPVGEQVLVRVDVPPEATPTGLILPRPKARMPTRGVVLAVGPGRWMNGNRIPVDLTPGEVVYFSHTVGRDIKVGDDYYLMIEESKILMAVSVGE